MQMAFCRVRWFSRALASFCKHLICWCRLREVVKCVLFTFNMPAGIRSKKVHSCFVLFCLGCYLWQGLCTFGNFYKKLNVIIWGPLLASLLLL